MKTFHQRNITIDFDWLEINELDTWLLIIGLYSHMIRFPQANIMMHIPAHFRAAGSAKVQQGLKHPLGTLRIRYPLMLFPADATVTRPQSTKL